MSLALGPPYVYSVNISDMNQKDNTVNMEKKPYHHGDLRAALVAEGLRLLEGSDSDSLSLREIARNAGVSATSVYRHFPDKQALLAALAQEGLARLATAQREAAAQAGGGAHGFAATGRAYVRFALANPALFRLIFASAAQHGLPVTGPDEPDAMAFLRENAAAARGASPDRPGDGGRSAAGLVNGPRPGDADAGRAGAGRRSAHRPACRGGLMPPLGRRPFIAMPCAAVA